MQDIKIQINFNNNIINFDGSTPLIEFKKYIDKLSIEDAHMIQKNVRKQINSYLKVIPKQEKINLEPPIIDDSEKEKINWKKETLKWKQESQKWEQKYNKLEKEFNDFKLEVKYLILELKTEINQLREDNKLLKNKVEFYDKKYNNEYDKVKSDLNRGER
ncbi:hypothetical protein [Spiroplasma cantharicola]|uniref:Uncharacterized protein n=1 Tax=Spiroplasma cantharicola TaxID=362837 RepID=A0A0M4JS87_9MOLU|nr:hypothetical protein [Spiroplasma cantharicola]ALD66372.1 hypothetical protein SCANT_v1c04660 [Spiroplasma cantharicola]